MNMKCSRMYQLSNVASKTINYLKAKKLTKLGALINRSSKPQANSKENYTTKISYSDIKSVISRMSFITMKKSKS